MRPRVILLCASLALAPAVSAHAQSPEAAPAPPAAAPALTLREALLEARRANPDLIALQRQSAVARAAVPAARFLDAPMVEAQIWGWPVTTLNPARTDMYMFMGEQALPGKGKRAARERVATEDVRLAEAQVPVRANAIDAAIRQAWVELFLARATAGLFAQQAPLLESMTELASIRYAAGQSGQHDTVRSLAELSRLGVDGVEWRERAQLAEAELNTLMGRSPDRPVPALSADDVAVPAEADAERLALERHPELAMAAAMIAREEAELARLQGERRPDYVVGGGYMLQPGGAGAWTARAGMSWPNAPWSRGRLNTEIATQQARVEAARAAREAAALTLRRGVRQAAVRLAAARDRARLLDTTVLPRITQAVDVATVAYRSNRGDYADLLDSQRLLLTTRMDLVAAQADVQRAASELESAIGLAPEN